LSIRTVYTSVLPYATIRTAGLAVQQADGPSL